MCKGEGKVYVFASLSFLVSMFNSQLPSQVAFTDADFLTHLCTLFWCTAAKMVRWGLLEP
jgi:hypothetical protein